MIQMISEFRHMMDQYSSRGGAAECLGAEGLGAWGWSQG